MPFAPELETLRKLREDAGLSQDEMARLCGLRGKLRRQTAGAWERGEMIPHRNRRADVMRYLWDALQLRNDPARFEEVWEGLMGVWDWQAIGDGEWKALTLQPRPPRPAAFYLEQRLAQLEAAFRQAQSAARSDSEPGAAARSVVAAAKTFDVALYTEAGKLKRPDTLFGREALAAVAYEYLLRAEPLLLSGVAGSGKSALAATLADRWLAEQRGALLWLAADGGDFDALLEAMAAPFDRQGEAAQRRGEAKLLFVRSLLAAEGVRLVVLDDVRQAGVPAQIERAMPAGVALLATSSYDAAYFAHSLKVGELGADAAQALLAHHARNSLMGEEDYRQEAAAAELCRRLSHHALALVVAGAWLKQNRRLAAELLLRLQSGYLTPATIAMPAAVAQSDHASVALVLASTLDSLGVAARRLFALWGRLAYPRATSEFLAFLDEAASRGDGSLLTGETRQEQTQAAGGGGFARFAVEDALDELAAWNFAEREGANRYRLHDLIHDFARYTARVSAAADLGAATALGEGTARYLAVYGRDFASLRDNFANVLAVAQDGDRRGDGELFLRLVGPLTTSAFLDGYGYSAAVMALLDGAVARLAAGPLSVERGALLHFVLSKRGNGAFEQGEYGVAAAAYQAALAVAPSHERRVRLLALVGKALAFDGDVSASRYFTQAHEAIVGDDSLRSFVLEQEAHVAGEQGDHETAWRVASEQVALNRGLVQGAGDAGELAEARAALFYSLINLGTALSRSAQGGLAQGLALHQEALALAQSARAESGGQAEWMAHALWALAEDYHDLGERAEAQAYLAAAYGLYREQARPRALREVVAFARQFGYGLPEVGLL